ncbi:D-erythronate dehydrogenase [Manduca sexta]|uniref:D-erythronate dehydrogenase n=1 Tax=Manduca sexta TaxID=7130 RepID=UPI001184073C|nr:D-erythronate dehydrogenase [Manduca sexta]
MKVIITGAAGFLGSRVADFLLNESSLSVTKLVLVDVTKPQSRPDIRVHTLAIDLGAESAAEDLLSDGADVLFHLAAVVSGHAEADFDLGLRVNFDATRNLLEAARRYAPALRFVFTSTVGVFGGTLPQVVDDFTATTPQNSYGIAKAMSELLVNDYSRRGYVDGRVVRLPTISVRAGIANKAVTSFASGIIREPLNGERSICPVPLEQELWLMSPGTAVQNIVHAATLSSSEFGPWRCVNLPGLCVAVRDMVSALRTIAGDQVAALVTYEIDENISRMVASFPSKFNTSRALSLGFVMDTNFVDVIRNYIKYDLNKPINN